MLNIVFSENARGSLRVAQHYGQGDFPATAIAIIGTHKDGSAFTPDEIEAYTQEKREKDRAAWARATPMGGKSTDIYGFSLELSIGDISQDEPGEKRLRTLESLYRVYPDHLALRPAQRILQRATQDLPSLRKRLDAGESVRIWYSVFPDDLCGFYWLMERLHHWGVPAQRIFTIKLPEWETGERGELVSYTGWGEMAPHKWQSYLSHETPVLPAFLVNCAFHWRDLQAENAPLRAALNGRLVSMPETLYDDFILREISAIEDETFQEAMLLSRVLTKYPLGISRFWIASRIQKMVDAGQLEEVAPAPADMPTFVRTLRKRQ